MLYVIGAIAMLLLGIRTYNNETERVNDEFRDAFHRDVGEGYAHDHHHD